ncbi:MAG TPA: DNA methyltransferase, partial [Anaerolineaceae bacterium]|nr:DNA methyltransferase [Anaerolineaceae bacterium]
KFDLRDGLADPKVTLLDPAAGTLTFPAEAIKLAVAEYVEKYGEGGKKGFIRDQILKNYYAFELMMAPYAIGHMKISILLESLGYKLQADDRFQLYLTNTLEMEEIDQIGFPGLHSLSEESQLAGMVKKEAPILVIMGNPPYSGMSANKNEWTELLLKTDIDGAQSYYEVDNKPLEEKNTKWLQDDYVKFLRFAQWKIHKAGRGIVAMITNHSYLDNPTFRGMRQSLTKTFDEICIIDLHGNSLKRETTPEGGKDENVFDIRQGVAIALFLKYEKGKKGKVFQGDVYGLREEKYQWLDENYCSTCSYPEVEPRSPYYFFIQRNVDNISHYLDWMKVNDIFPVNSVGIVTARDKLTIKWSKDEIWTTVLNFSKYDEEYARAAYNLGKDARDWKVGYAQKDIVESGLDKEKIKPILYRPFDVRYTYYTGNSRGFHCMPRPEVMGHLLDNNLAISVVRQVKTGDSWQHCLITDKITESCYISNRTSEIGYIFPLYLYPYEQQIDLFSQPQVGKKSNIVSKIFEQLTQTYSIKPSPEQIQNYIYAILYSNIYRKMYFDFLKIDFPRIPFTSKKKVFIALSDLGQRLINLHLLKSKELNQPTVKFQGQGEDLTVGRRRYDEETGWVYINKDYYFEGVAPEIWEYQIGGYQVMDKYLKDRKGRRMEDPRHYIHLATALEKTIEIQAEIDAIYPEVEKDVIQF